ARRCACRSVARAPRRSSQDTALIEPALVEQVLITGRAQPPLERVAALDAALVAEVVVAALAAVHRYVHRLGRRLGRLGVGCGHKASSRLQVSSTSISPTAISKLDVAMVRSTTFTVAAERSLMAPTSSRVLDSSSRFPESHLAALRVS